MSIDMDRIWEECCKDCESKLSPLCIFECPVGYYTDYEDEKEGEEGSFEDDRDK